MGLNWPFVILLVLISIDVFGHSREYFHYTTADWNIWREQLAGESSNVWQERKLTSSWLLILPHYNADHQSTVLNYGQSKNPLTPAFTALPKFSGRLKKVVSYVLSFVDLIWKQRKKIVSTDIFLLRMLNRIIKGFQQVRSSKGVRLEAEYIQRKQDVRFYSKRKLFGTFLYYFGSRK